jgi:HSP20 family molecular chaperone IbpA
MAFFPRAFGNTTTNEAAYTPLFRFLEDFDTYSRSAAPSADSGRHSSAHQHRQHQPAWQPRFDVRETADAYELYGELPGLSKQNVSIDFPEHQTIRIHGKTERSYVSASPSSNGTSAQTSVASTTAETDQRRSSYHSATVEDESEENDKFEIVSKPTEDKSSVAAATPKYKYWLTERSIGDFARTFQLPARIDQEAVAASLDNGILKVLIPKAKVHKPHRVIVN